MRTSAASHHEKFQQAFINWGMSQPSQQPADAAEIAELRSDRRGSSRNLVQPDPAQQACVVTQQPFAISTFLERFQHMVRSQRWLGGGEGGFHLRGRKDRS